MECYFPRWPITRIQAVNNVSLGMPKVRYPTSIQSRISNPQKTPSMANNLGLMNAFCACCHQIGIVHLRNPLVFFFVASHKLPCASPDVFITHMASEREGYVCTAKETGLTANLANWLLLHYDPSGLPPPSTNFLAAPYTARAIRLRFR